MTDRERLLACYEPEEWQWWIEGLMLGEDNRYNQCLFCCAANEFLLTCNQWELYR